tara:strand:+ start:2555 stop:2830 length:276 start_codon:yes stop_codon:yes gene_type:complete
MKLGYFYGRTGRQIANQNIVYTPEFTMFVSYDTNIIKTTFDEEGKRMTILDRYYWNYSKTTGKYRNEFLGEGIAETRKKIEEGKYILANLN